jgi:hypothetical protein
MFHLPVIISDCVTTVYRLTILFSVGDTRWMAEVAEKRNLQECSQMKLLPTAPKNKLSGIQEWECL